MESIIRCILVISVIFDLHPLTQTAHIPNISEDNLFPLSIIHINDFHARFEESNESGTSCKLNETCIGGYARAVTVIKELQKTRLNPIYLNAGDNFQGSLWYTLGGWNVTQHFLNMLNADAMTLGNHDFDRGIAGVVPFMEHIKSPIVVANIDDSDEPSFQGKYQKSIVIERNNRKIGIIGVILNSTNEIAHTEKLRFYNESEIVRREATLLREQGVNIIIVLSHCGLDVDYQIAKETAPLVDVIVGSHTHTFMYSVKNGETAPGPGKVADKYPAVVENENGHRVLIVQASAYMKYVGDLIVYFDQDGRVVHWDGNPIYLDTNVKQDPHIMAELQPWKKIIDAKGQRVIGRTKVPLKQGRCNTRECNLGNFVSDAYKHSYIKSLLTKGMPLKDSIIGMVNAGGLRNTINAGLITFSDIATTIPFENSVDVFDMRGDHLKEVFEHGSTVKRLIQVSGARLVYNNTKEILNRLVSIEIMTVNDNNVIKYEPLDLNKMYRCVSNSFLTEGGDSFHMIPKNMKNLKKGMIDIDVVEEYLKDRQVIYTGLEHRIRIIH